MLLMALACWLVAGCQVLLGISDVDESLDAGTSTDARLRDAGSADGNAPMLRRIRLSFLNSTRSETLSSFPVLVKLNPDRIRYALTSPGGADVRFVDADGTVLAHEIERWDPARESWIWVKVPVIDAFSNSDFIELHYGDIGAGVEQQPSAVWSDGFEGVYHLGEDLTSVAEARDSTMHGRHGTVFGRVAAVPGAVGAGMRFPGASDSYIDLGDIEAYEAAENAPLTVEVWFRAEPSDVSRHSLFYKDYGCRGWKLYKAGESLMTYFSATPSDCGAQENIQTVADGLANERWYYAIGRMHRNNPAVLNSCTTVYWDEAGTRRDESQCLDDYAGQASSNNDGPALIGIGIDQSEPFQGIIDEARVSSTIRSSAWLEAQYDSMADAFLVYGPDEALP